MKSKLMIVCAVVALSLSLLACSSGAKQVSVEIDDFMKVQHISQEVEVSVDSSLTVTLGSNPTTGFRWSESAEISDTSVLEQTDHEFIAPEGEGDTPPAPGTSGQEIWTFKALKKGTTEVSMEYGRPWEGGEKAEWTFVLTVVVK